MLYGDSFNLGVPYSFALNILSSWEDQGAGTYSCVAFGRLYLALGISEVGRPGCSSGDLPSFTYK